MYTSLAYSFRVYSKHHAAVKGNRLEPQMNVYHNPFSCKKRKLGTVHTMSHGISNLCTKRQPKVAAEMETGKQTIGLSLGWQGGMGGKGLEVRVKGTGEGKFYAPLCIPVLQLNKLLYGLSVVLTIHYVCNTHSHM